MSGEYRCVVYGEDNFVISKPAKLTVSDSGNVCDKPSENIIQLPKQCVSAGNPASHDSKTCNNQICERGDCWETTKPKKCCVPETYVERNISCGASYTFPAISVSECQCGSCETENVGNTIQVRGTVKYISDNTPINKAKVTVVSSTVTSTTDNAGMFVLDVTVLFKDRLVIKVEDTETVARFVPYIEILKITMNSAPNELVTEIKISKLQYKVLELSSLYFPDIRRHKMIGLHIPEETEYESEDGQKYTGEVLTSIELFDNRQKQAIAHVPGETMTVYGSSKSVVKFQAVFSLSIWKETEGKVVRVKPVTSAGVSVYINRHYAERSLSGGVRNRVYSLNMETGYWEIEGVAMKHRNAPNNMMYIASFKADTTKSWFGVGINTLTKNCFLKVASFLQNPAKALEQTVGARIDVYTKLTKINTQAVYVRSHSHFTKKSSVTCIPVICDGRIQSVQALWSGNLAEVDVVSKLPIATAEAKRLGMVSKLSENMYETTKIIKGPTAGNGPISYDKSLEECEKQDYTAGSLVFYTGSSYPYEMTVRPNIIPSDPIRNKLVWYPSQYKACYIEVTLFNIYVELPEMVVTVLSRGGTHASIKNIILGVRKDSTINDKACVEYKCSGAFDAPIGTNTDDTLVDISVESKTHECLSNWVSETLRHAENAINPAVQSFPWQYQKTVSIRINKEKNLEKTMKGVYIAESKTSQSKAKQDALRKCQENGTSDAAVVFMCN